MSADAQLGKELEDRETRSTLKETRSTLKETLSTLKETRSTLKEMLNSEGDAQL